MNLFDIYMLRLTPSLSEKYIKLEKEDLVKDILHDVYQRINRMGVKIIERKIEVTIVNYKKLIEYLFSEYKIVDCQNKREEKRYPDFKLKHKENDNVFYIEVKSDNDGLHSSQAKWIYDNKDKEIWIMYFKKNGKILLDGDIDTYEKYEIIEHPKEDPFKKKEIE